MEKVIRLIILVLTMLTIVGCPDYDQFSPDSKLIFVNNSGKILLRTIDFHNYPDTLINWSNPFRNETQKKLSLISSSSKKEENHEFQKYFSNPDNNSTIMIYLFLEETVSKVPWDSIRTNYMILKRYDISKEKFQAVNWELTITYP